ncbi:MAG: phage shock protein PspC (stress-responsive transcriptional regulator) [Saprospiraceae bacterium]|jgi:phage shock protein PspC (stress-responsive transcriptional regulator)
MNNITTVNLGGYPFTIDENAHKALELYLETIEAHFSDSEGCDEILDDIEARIAELFSDFLQGKSIVTLKEYDAMVKVMGKPEDFGAESLDEDMEVPKTSSKKTRKGKYSHIKTGKRLFRDPDEKVIGGVCSGVAAYFGVADPLWIRLGFIALVFIGGISVLLYPILWAIVPPAKTAGDKLKMKGEPATVSNIAKTVEEELTELSHKITEISKDLGSKKKINAEFFLSPKRAISGLFALMGKGVLGILGIVKAIVKPIFSVSLGLMLLVLGVLWGAWIISFLSSFSFLSYIGPSSWIMTFFGRISLFFTVGIPILGLMLWITKWFSTYRIPKKWRTNMRLGWVASFALTIAAGVMTGLSYVHSAEINQTASYNIEADVIKIAGLERAQQVNVGLFHIPGLSYRTEGGIVFGDVEYDIVKGTKDEVVITTKIKSQGKSHDDAQALAEKVDIQHKVEGDKISLHKNFEILKGDKYRAQSVHYTVHIPEGKTIKFDESLALHLDHKGFNGEYEPRNFMDFNWTMTSEGLVSNDWENKYRATRKIDTETLANLNIDGAMETTITYGKKLEVLLKGIRADIDKVEEIITADATSLKYDKSGWDRRVIRLEIVTPNLETLHAKNLSSLKIEGFKQDAMEINYSGGRSSFELDAYLDVQNLTCNIGGYNQINLIGSGEYLTMNILDGTTVNAEQYKTKSVKVTGNVNRQSSFYASESFDCPEHEKHNIKLFGNPGLLAVNEKVN